MNFNLYNITLAGYLLACISYLIHSVFKSRAFGNTATLLLSIGLISGSLYLINRGIQAGRFPIIGLFESVIFFSWSTALTYFILERVYKFRLLGVPVTLIVVLAWGYGAVLDRSIKPLLPALKNNWIIIHVSSYFIGYGCLAVSFICGLIYIFTCRRNAPLALWLDTLSYRLVNTAFPFLTIGLTTGAIWAKTAWGSYWSWDPKETWALITWLTYAAYLHLRALKNWQGKKAAIINIIGFLCVIFTFFGVNYLMPGLHSYLK